MKKYFFGWTNIKFVIREFINIYSNRDSFFSKKRIESSIAFFVAQSGLIMFLFIHLATMTTLDITGWAAIEFGIAGYTVSQIQKEKILDKNTPDTEEILKS